MKELLMLILMYLAMTEAMTAQPRWTNPMTFWTLVPGKNRIGPAEFEITLEESSKLVENFAKRTLENNKVSVSSTVSAEGVIKAFDVSAEITSGYEHFTETEYSEETSKEKQMASRIHATFQIEKGSWGLVMAEMNMFVFQLKSGKIEHLIIPTGSIYAGPVYKQSIKNQVLDNSFTSPARQFSLTTYTHGAMQDLIAGSSKLPIVGDRKGCLPDWTQFQDSCYKAMLDPLTWHEAEESCKKHASHLVSIEGPSENSKVSSLIEQPFWTGGYRVPGNPWTWTGVENRIGYSSWAPGSPNNWKGNQHRLVGNHRKELWDDAPEDARFPYVCEYEIGAMCASGWKKYKGSCYKFMPGKLNWDEAQKNCRRNENEAHSVFIQDSAENSFVSALANYEVFWTGGVRRSGKWQWCTANLGSCENVVHTSWAPGKPNNWKGNQHSLVGNHQENLWDDANEKERFSSVCEYELEA